MDFLQNFDPSLLPYIGVGCALLCLVLIVIGFVLQAVSGFFDVIVGLIEIVVEILQGGPVAWCGCVLLVLGTSRMFGVGIPVFECSHKLR